MYKLLFIALILFSQSIHASDITTTKETLECNKHALEINDHQVELGFVVKSIAVYLKTAELIKLTNEKLIYAGEVAQVIGDQAASSQIAGQILMHQQMFKDVENEYNNAIGLEAELSTEIINLTMKMTEQSCSTEKLSTNEIFETCNAYKELEENLNCIALKKDVAPEKKDEPKKAHPGSLRV